ncbi:MAG TPA: hypothetical protein VJX67_11660 [Blastocatellia bacterium]|nr:hypothetical protein [Blastocatellia bacterium]
MTVDTSPVELRRHITWRRTLLIMIFGAGVVHGLLAINGASPRVYDGFRLLAELTVFAAAAVMGYAAASQFSRAQKSRLTWMLISIGAALFFVADVGIYLPSASGLMPGANWALLTAVAAITLSRILLVWALWSMVSVYRNSGLGLKFYKRDYAAIVIFGALNMLTVLFGANSVRFQLSASGANLIHWVLIICLPLPFGLILCSALAVIIWRYSQQMGGGLVAKAWRGVLAYMVLLPVRTVLVGLGANLFGRGSHWTWVIGSVSYFGLALAVWAVYLGASYQYEASTEAVPTDDEFVVTDARGLDGKRRLEAPAG